MRFPRSEFERRIKRVREEMERRRLDILAIFSAAGSMRYGQRGHVMYLSGYEPYFGSDMMLLPLEEELEALLMLDQASFFPSDITWITNVKEAADPVRVISDYLKDSGISRPSMGIVGEYSVHPQTLARIRESIPHSNLEYVSDLLENERMVKSEYEIDCIKGACAIAEIGADAAARFARPGKHDHEIVAEIERACREAGAEGFPHHTMVSSGSDRSYLEWWWYASRRRLGHNDSFILDFGVMNKGYCCDIARSFHVGSAPEEMRDVYETIVEAERAAQRAARPGAFASEVDRAAAEVLGEFEGWITTGEVTDIGHGIGLEAHEWPFIGYHHIENDPTYRDVKLGENMVISVEPQIYHPRFGLVQIEDQFRVTGSGGEILIGLPQEIIECG